MGEAQAKGAAGGRSGSAREIRGRSLWLLAAVPWLMVLGNSMLFPIFPKMQSAIGVTEMQTSVIVTAFSITAGLLIPVAGYLSDRYGRRPVMVPGVVLFGLGALVAALASTFLAHPYGILLVGRVIQGMGAAAMSQLAMAMAADLFEGRTRPRAMGTIEAANGFGKVVSPISGAAVGLIAWFLPFYIFAALSLPLSLALWFLTREPAGAGQKIRIGPYIQRIRRIFDDRGMALVSGLLSGIAIMFLLFGTLFFLSEALEKRFHVSEMMTGLILAIPVAALSVTSYVVGSGLAKRQPLSRPAVLTGVAALGAVMGVLALWHSRTVLYVAISFMGLGAGVALPSLNLLITSSAKQKERGLITSLYGAVRFFGVALGPPTFGFLMKKGEPILFGVAAAFAFATLVVAYFLLSSKKLLAKEGGSGPQEGPGSERPREGTDGPRVKRVHPGPLPGQGVRTRT